MEMPLSKAPPPSSTRARNVMRGNRSESEIERQLRSALHRKGRRFRKHARPVAELRCRPDIVFPGPRVAVFIDGCFWHRCPLHGSEPIANAEWWRAKLDGNVARDRRNDEALAAAGWRCIRLWSHESLPTMVKVVEDALDEDVPGPS
jgi:DNA mismatch endonuclease, patch repair protein